MITNLSTTPVKCSHCTLFSETNTVRVAKKGAILPHRKHLENCVAELMGVLQVLSYLLTDYRLL